jgi:hypothetical protein
MSASLPTWQNWQRRKPKQLCSHYMLWDQPFFSFVLAKFRQKEKLKFWKTKWFQRGSIAKCKGGKKTPIFYIWFSVCSHKHRIFILNISTSYPVPKDDGHFCYEGWPLRLHKKFLKKKALVGISFMHFLIRAEPKFCEMVIFLLNPPWMF